MTAGTGDNVLREHGHRGTARRSRPTRPAVSWSSSEVSCHRTAIASYEMRGLLRRDPTSRATGPAIASYEMRGPVPQDRRSRSTGPAVSWSSSESSSHRTGGLVVRDRRSRGAAPRARPTRSETTRSTLCMTVRALRGDRCSLSAPAELFSMGPATLSLRSRPPILSGRDLPRRRDTRGALAPVGVGARGGRAGYRAGGAARSTACSGSRRRRDGVGDGGRDSLPHDLRDGRLLPAGDLHEPP